MRLCKLQVIKNNNILREITFKKGLNLIVNVDSKVARSGNSVGKSTPSRLIDFIFMSSGDDIYTESEFRKVIPEVAELIDENEIIIELYFVGFDGKNHLIGRNLTRISKNSLFYIRHSAPDLGINLPIALTQYLQNDLLV
ncbi:hypothetical protein Q7I17_17730, partial [Aeromonas veronii]